MIFWQVLFAKMLSAPKTGPFFSEVVCQNGELLPEQEVLGDEIPTATKETSKRAEREQKYVAHGPEF